MDTGLIDFKRPFHFKFENFRLQVDGFDALVVQCCNELSVGREKAKGWPFKIYALKQKWKGWSFNLNKDLRDKKELLSSQVKNLADIQDIRNLVSDELDSLFSFNPDIWTDSEKVSIDDNLYLIAPFSEFEIKKVIFDMAAEKAPSIDGLLDFINTFGNYVKVICCVCLMLFILVIWI